MSWKDGLEPASFRGVAFFVSSNDMTFGRETQIHKYPKRDKAYVEDLGKAGKSVTFDAYVIGRDYTTQKNALIDAIDEEGPGELIHPLYGIRRVQAGICSIRESKDEGGMARFSLEFNETIDPAYPASENDTSKAVSIAADSAIDSAVNEFTESFDVAGLPQWAVDKSSELLSKASDTMAQAFTPLKAGAEKLATLNQSIIKLKEQAGNLVRMPGELASTTRLLIGSIATSSDEPSSGVSSLLDFYNGFNSKPESVSTETRAKVEKNRAAMDTYLKQVALAEAVRIAPGQEYVSLTEAENQRDELGDLLDAQADEAADDSYIALTTLRATMVEAIPNPSASLPDIVNITLQETTPAVVLAYRLYENANRDSEIAARNKVQHPGFIPGGIPIEVLTRE